MGFTLLGILSSAASAAPVEPFYMEYLVIGGGGGGGNVGAGGGGGAGGYRSSVTGELSGAGSSAESQFTFVTDDFYTLTIGAGGAVATQGNNSVFASITSLGGGRGGNAGSAGVAGGSGGGGGSGSGGYFPPGGAGTSNQGKNGGGGFGYDPHSGGGGGANGIGVSGNRSVYADGGRGITSSITGSAVGRGGGGGGGSSANNSNDFYGRGYEGGGQGGKVYAPAVNSLPGSPNTGGGGGGGGPYSNSGGSGVVILRYPNTNPDITNIGPGLVYSYANTGGFKIYQFTSGSDTIGW